MIWTNFLSLDINTDDFLYLLLSLVYLKLDRTDLSLIEWIEHAKQEHMDAILYLEKIKWQFLQEEQQ